QTQQARAVIGGLIGLRERRTGERIHGARGVAIEQQHLAAMHLEREDTRSQRERAAPRPLRLWPRPEPGGAALVRLLVTGGEQAGERRILGERQDTATAKEGVRLVERPEGAVRCEPALEEPPLPKLRESRHEREINGGRTRQSPAVML